ncbi:MAG: cupredoxin domain-containing protein [Pseudoxanthomonas sp.]
MRSHLARALPVAAGLLALAACAPPPQTPADGVPETAVSVTDTACVPNEVTVKAGKNRFVISNRSMRPLEWEILDGVMVVDERENIVPGLVQKLTTTLKPGTYVMTCGLLTNPRGTLVVTENADAPKTGPTPLEFVSAQAEYKVFVHERLQAMQGEVGEFATALRAGDLARARQLYGPSRRAWQQLAPVAVLASAQYDRLEGAATLYRGGESDPDFVGWHRIEAALFGADAASAQQLPELADKLEADAKAFADGIGSAKIGVDGLFKGASLAAQRIAERKLKGLDNPRAGTDLADAADNVVGLRKLATVFDRALGEHAPQQKAALQAGLDTLQAGLQPAADGQPLADAERARLSAAATQLSHDFTATLEHLGL